MSFVQSTEEKLCNDSVYFYHLARGALTIPEKEPLPISENSCPPSLDF